MTKASLRQVYRALDDHYGDLGWWPGKSALEIIVGAILTQNTAWTNVEKCIRSLKTNRMLSLSGLRAVPAAKLAPLIRASGYFNQKSVKLKNFISHLDAYYAGSLLRMAGKEASAVRTGLLSVKGIGPETADSVLLYALGKPVFVVDAYTRRIMKRLGLLKGDEPYEALRRWFEEGVSGDLDAYPSGPRGRKPGKRKAMIFNQFHALIVNLGKDFCRSRAPRCPECPLKGMGPCSW